MLDVELYKENSDRRKQLAKLVDKYYLEMHSKDYISDIDKCLGFIDTQYMMGKELWLLTDNGKPIGFGILCINNEYGMIEDSIEQEYLFVKKRYRKGVGAAMLVRLAIRGCVHYGIEGTVPAFKDGEASKMAKALGMETEIEILRFNVDTASNSLDRLDRLINRRSRYAVKED